MITIERMSFVNKPALLDMFVSYDDKISKKTAEELLAKSPLIGLILKDNRGNISHGLFSPEKKGYFTTSKTIFKDRVDLDSVYKISRTMGEVFTALNKKDININAENLKELTQEILDENQNRNIVINSNAVNIIADNEIISTGSLFNPDLTTKDINATLGVFSDFINKGKEIISKALNIEKNMVNEFNNNEEIMTEQDYAPKM